MRSLLALALGIVLGTSTSAPGALWLPYHLNSLAMESDAIVQAEKVGSRTVTDSRGRGYTLSRYRVEKVYSGALLPGEVLELYDSGYPREGAGPFGEAPKAGFDDQVIAFLQRSERRSYGALSRVAEEDRPRFSIVHSGLRLLSEGKVYTFAQFMNPGGIVPTPATSRDAGRHHVTLEELEREIRDSIVRVEALRRAASLKDPVKRRELLLGTLGEYEKEAERRKKHAVGSFLDAKDLFLQGVVDLLVEAGDLQGALEVFAIWPYESIRLDGNLALSAAADTEIPPRLRTAAVGTFEWRNFRAPATIRGLGELLDDPVDEVRAAAAERLRYLRRGYRRNTQSHTEELDAVWARAEAKLAEMP